MHAVVWGVAMTNKIWINQFKATQSDWENIKELSPKWIQIVRSTFSCGMKWLNPSRTNWWFMLVLCPSRTPRFDMKTGLLPIEIYIRKNPTTYANYQPNIFVATQYVQVYEHI